MSGSPSAAHSVSFVVPVYNSAEILPALVDEIDALRRREGIGGELILVNDGSRDASWSEIRRLAALHSWVHGIDLMRNFGQHNALLCGIRTARCPVIVTLDDDLQHPPSEVPALLARLDEGFDVVYGTPEEKQHGLWRNMVTAITKLALEAAMGVHMARSVSAFRAMRTRVRDGFEAYRGSFVSVDVLLTWGTTRFSAVTVRHHPRRAGVSQYSLRKLATHSMNMLTGFSIRPLQLASWIGFGLTLFGVAILAWVVGRYLIQGATVPGFAFLASIIALFSGAQLFALGIMGEYLARIHFRTMDRPPYVVRETEEGERPVSDEGR